MKTETEGKIFFKHSFIFKHFIGIYLIYNVLLVPVYSKVNPLYTYICPLSFRFYSYVGHYRLLSRLLCVVQWVLTSYLFYTFGHLIQRADSLEKTLMLGKIEDRRRRGRQRMRWLAGQPARTGQPGVLQSMGSQRVGHD